jgi:hypothetical protein
MESGKHASRMGNQTMTDLARFDDSLLVTFDASGLYFRWIDEQSLITPKNASLARLQLELQQAEELGLTAKEGATAFCVKFEDFGATEDRGLTLTTCWTKWSPFLLRIDRISDIGVPNFAYKYQFLAGSRPIQLERTGYFVLRTGSTDVFRLDRQTYSLVQMMDAFNALSPAEKTKEQSWLTFASVKDCANRIGAILDGVLQSNDVIVPSSIGLRIHDNEDGTVSFVPECPEVSNDQFLAIFTRNKKAEGLYSLDQGSNGRVRVVLNERQQAVLARMKNFQRLAGAKKQQAISNPAQFFDGMLEDVDMVAIADADEVRYSRRVEGIGEFEFVSNPHNPNAGGMARLWNDAPVARETELQFVNSMGEKEKVSITAAEKGELRALLERAGLDQRETVSFKGHTIPLGPDLIPTLEGKSAGSSGRSKYLLIYTDDQETKPTDLQRAESASGWAISLVFTRPAALRRDIDLKEHQREGITWLQTCHAHRGRRGVLLADDMGLGKTLQILTFLAYCIEEQTLPDLSRSNAPFRPVLVMLPLILLENETWQSDMRRFFENEGSIFQPVLSLHGAHLKRLRRERTGAEVELGMPVLDVDEIQKHRVVLTTYDTIKNYQHSFAALKDGKPLWSVVITDEAQEYKMPNTKVSHAIKAIDGDFHIASTGTPVENRLLDLWNIFDSLQPALLGSAREFNNNYERRAVAGQGPDALEPLKRKLLFNRPNAFLLRREKTQLQGLPSKHEHKLFCRMSEVETGLHQQLVQSIAKQQSNIHLSVLQDLSLLYQHPLLLIGDADAATVDQLLSSSSKLKEVLSKLRDIQARREKVLIFARHIAMQRILARIFSSVFNLNVRIINGATQRAGANSSYNTARARATRSGILDDFRGKAGFDVLVLSPFVAGVGLTITEANHVIHYGRWWNPAVESQATDRVYRIGQEKDVHVWLPILKDSTGTIPVSFDERLDELLSSRSRLAKDFLCPLEDEQTNAQELYQALKIEGTGSTQQIGFEDVAEMQALDFEAFVGCLYLHQGFNVVLTAKGNDGGADLVASKEGRMAVIQVKHSRTGRSINLNAIDDVIAAADTYASAVGRSGSLALVTNSAFSRDVLVRAREHGISVIDALTLRELLGQYPVSLAEVWALGRNRARSFSEGIRLIKEHLTVSSL